MTWSNKFLNIRNENGNQLEFSFWDKFHKPINLFDYSCLRKFYIISMLIMNKWKNYIKIFGN